MKKTTKFGLLFFGALLIILLMCSCIDDNEEKLFLEKATDISTVWSNIKDDNVISNLDIGSDFPITIYYTSDPLICWHKLELIETLINAGAIVNIIQNSSDILELEIVFGISNYNYKFELQGNTMITNIAYNNGIPNEIRWKPSTINILTLNYCE